MPDKHSKAVSAIFSQPWAILQEELHGIIAIANRDFSDLAAAAEKRSERTEAQTGIQSEKVAIIPVFGPIIPRASLFDNVSGAVSLANLSAQLEDALADPEIDSVLLNVDSPGGQVTGVHEFAERIRASRAIKPVNAHITGMCASAAYWIASACGTITADETAKIGSIGVVYVWTDDSVAKEKQGIKDYTIISTQSPNKNLDPKTKAGRGELQRLADGTAEIFMRDVARNRGTKFSDVEKNYGCGRVMLANDALAAGMIDAIGVIDAVLGNLSGRNIQELSMTKIGKNAPRTGTKTKAKNGNADTDADRDDEDEDEDSAETDEDEENEPKKPESNGKATGKTKASVTLQQFKTSYPDAYNAAFNAGVAKERARIKAIKELGIIGHDELIERAMFDAPMSAAKLSLAILKAEGSLRRDLGAAIEAETANIYAKSSPVAAGSSSSDDADIALMAGLSMGSKK